MNFSRSVYVSVHLLFAITLQITFEKFSVVDSDLPQIYLRLLQSLVPLVCVQCACFKSIIRYTHSQKDTHIDNIQLCVRIRYNYLNEGH